MDLQVLKELSKYRHFCCPSQITSHYLIPPPPPFREEKLIKPPFLITSTPIDSNIGVEYGAAEGLEPPRNFTRGLSPCGNFAELNCCNYTG